MKISTAAMWRGLISLKLFIDQNIKKPKLAFYLKNCML